MGGLTADCAGLVAKFVPSHVAKFSPCSQLLYSSGEIFVKRYFQFVGIYLQAFAILLPATFIFVFETTAHCGNTNADSFSVPVASFQSFSQILSAYSPSKTRAILISTLLSFVAPIYEPRSFFRHTMLFVFIFGKGNCPLRWPFPTLPPICYGHVANFMFSCHFLSSFLKIGGIPPIGGPNAPL